MTHLMHPDSSSLSHFLQAKALALYIQLQGNLVDKARD